MDVVQGLLETCTALFYGGHSADLVESPEFRRTVEAEAAAAVDRVADAIASEALRYWAFLAHHSPALRCVFGCPALTVRHPRAARLGCTRASWRRARGWSGSTSGGGRPRSRGC